MNDNISRNIHKFLILKLKLFKNANLFHDDEKEIKIF
jgi:hypothetical protein